MTDAERVARMKLEILDDIMEGTVPEDVPNYSALHDYVDANMYGGFCDETGDDWSATLDQFNRCIDLVDAWLRARVPQFCCGAITEETA